MSNRVAYAPLLMALVVLFVGSSSNIVPAKARVVHAPPSISVTPGQAVPHGSIQVAGGGYDASTSGRQVLVDVIVTNSGGAFALGSVPTDASGNLITNGIPALTLPFNLDASQPNTITAIEEGNTALIATTTLTGIALAPQLNGGQALSGQAGSQIEVKGTGFAPSDVVAVNLGGQALNSGGQNSANADQTGAIDIVLAVPQNAQTGPQILKVTGKATGTGQTDQASITLTINGVAPTPGNLTVLPNPAAVGTTIRASASNFQPNEPVTFALKYFDSGQNSYAVQNSQATADASGAASALVNVPASADGSKPASVTAIGITSGRTYTVALSFAVLAKLSFNIPEALAGGQVVVSGSGFVSGESLFVTTRLFKPVIGRFALVDATGGFSVTVTLFPNLAPGTTLVLAVSGTGGDNASANFTIAAPVPTALQVTPKTAKSGDPITVTGVGFGPNETVSLLLNDLATAPLGSAISDGLGAFTTTVTLTATLASGNYTLQGQGATSGFKASAPIQVTLPQSNRWYFAEGFTGQGPRVFFHETITLLNPGNQPATGTIGYAFPDGSMLSLTINVPAHGLRVEDVNSDVGPNKAVSAAVQTDQPIYAERTIIRTTAAKKSLDTDFSPGQSAPQTAWYFAEGYSGVTFQPYLTAQNPFSTPVTMTVTLRPVTGAAVVRNASLLPFGRYTLNLRSALPNRSFSMIVQATGPIVAERVQYWGDGAGSAKFGAGVKPGVPLPATTWQFGFVSILGGDQAYISVLNPGTKQAKVKASFFDGTGKGAGTTTLAVGGGRRATLNVGAILSKVQHSPIAVVLSSDLGVVAEVAQYFGGSPNKGEHPGAAIEGRTATAGTWSFASGDTAQYQESEYLFNPGDKDATVIGTFIGADGQVVSASYQVKPHAVISVSANKAPGLPKGTHGSVWTVRAGPPVIVVQVLHSNDGRAALANQGIPG